MLNRVGGHIFLGVEDSGKIVGVYKEYVKEMKRDFANLCNNPEKIFPTVHLDMKEYVYDEKVILYTYVHESSDVHRSANKVFDRNDDGDFDITANTTQISNMYIRKSSTYIENKIYPFATMDDLRKDLIESYERLVEFIKKHLNDKFYIEGDRRINVRDVIARELCANLLMHREYSIRIQQD